MVGLESKLSKGNWEVDRSSLGNAFRYAKYGRYRELEKAIQDSEVSVDDQYGPKNNTLLCVAASHGHLRIVKLLLRNKADINFQNSEGNSPMHLANIFNYKELVNYLISKGANKELKNKRGHSPLEESVDGPDEAS
ncbi:hypothetical protein GUITHDRAFT_151976 [Guillardia theta CCMP2712]|uniref:Uncharacterized protein n=1 Tax=Guillardia theta (strain CCMP2712) TaxID=905079 RepID=L1JHP1_GUITC|nr:hypothetical protein GUITHDRAFT_151976 [Guillardia theta CCMP2712]EKX47817.1 hypothetical protein GUITHDRAFT_151976 [Guillardia theta CCMP2712]|eukprot:XP_005834797.1 hypothetical protein GUITHDRAFT_151976 [Guillardia theta CCMP2712]